MNIKPVFELQVDKLCSCLKALSTQVGYIVPWMYEIYIVWGNECIVTYLNIETKKYAQQLQKKYTLLKLDVIKLLQKISF